MARGYRQLERGDFVYRMDSRCYQREYRVESIVLDKEGEPVKVAVGETSGGTIANPGQYTATVYWSLAQIDADANPRYWNGRNRVTDADDRTVKSASFDRMKRKACKEWAAAKAAREQRELRES